MTLIHVNYDTSCKAGLGVLLFQNIKHLFGVNSNQTTGKTLLLPSYGYLCFLSEYFDFCWLIPACVDDHLSQKTAVHQMGPTQRVSENENSQFKGILI